MGRFDHIATPVLIAFVATLLLRRWIWDRSGLFDLPFLPVWFHGLAVAGLVGIALDSRLGSRERFLFRASVPVHLVLAAFLGVVVFLSSVPRPWQGCIFGDGPFDTWKMGYRSYGYNWTYASLSGDLHFEPRKLFFEVTFAALALLSAGYALERLRKSQGPSPLPHRARVPALLLSLSLVLFGGLVYGRWTQLTLEVQQQRSIWVGIVENLFGLVGIDVALHLFCLGVGLAETSKIISDLRRESAAGSETGTSA